MYLLTVNQLSLLAVTRDVARVGTSSYGLYISIIPVAADLTIFIQSI